jgi:hypothetical protein
MHRLETSTTQADAAWAYLLDKSKSFSKPVNEINTLNLRKVKLGKNRPVPKQESFLTRKLSSLFAGF